MNNIYKKVDWKITLFLVIIIFSIFLRVYKFNDWLVFKTDQTRDINMVSRSFENGPGELPLLGPRAGGTLLRLGPMFYYLEYLATLATQSTEPPVFAYPNLIFSLLTVPLFYLFLRKYFEQNWSMVLTALLGVSFLAVEYSRFAWNPNSIPFFTLLFLYSLLEIFDGKAEKTKSWWVLLAGASFAIATQHHFSSFLTLPLFILLFLLINRKNVKGIATWKNAGIFIGVSVLLYVPVIISDIFNQGDNIRQFFYSLGTKSSDHSLGKNIIKDVYYFGKYFLRILTGYMGGNRLWHVLTLGFIAGSLFSAYKLFKSEEDIARQNFIFLPVGLLFIYGLVYVPLAYGIDKPRFFLPVLIVPFIFFGFLAKYLMEKYKFKYLKYGIAFFAAIFFFGNAFGTLAWFKEMGDSQKKAVRPDETIILKAKKDPVWLTWSHFEKMGKTLVKDCGQPDIYFVSDKNIREYDESLEYSLERFAEGKKIHTIAHKIKYNPTACYYYISRSWESVPDQMKGDFNFSKKFTFGSYAADRFAFKDSSIPAIDTRTPEKIKEAEQDALDDVIEVKKEELEGKPKVAEVRKPRAYWKDVFGNSN